MKRMVITTLKVVGIVILLCVVMIVFGANRALLAFAGASNNAAMCPVLNFVPKFEVSPGYSVGDCYVKVAVTNNNPGACAYAGSKAGYCYSEVAEKYGNMSLCERIDSGNISRGGCYEAFIQEKADISTCQGLTDANSRYACYMYYVINVEPNVSICEQNVQQGHNNYKDHCYYAAAVARKDTALCDRITVDYDKKNCRAQANGSQ